jgi:hypothetical protein
MNGAKPMPGSVGKATKQNAYVLFMDKVSAVGARDGD